MPLTDSEYKALIVSEIGDTPSGVLASSIDTYWTRAELEATTELRYLRAKMTAIRVVMGAERRTSVDSSSIGGISSKLQQRMQSLQTMLSDTKVEYDSQVATIGSYAGVVGQLTTTAPVSPPTGSVDANSLDYAGNPYTTRSRRG